jgi:phosphatidylinositol alpha-mannosyltransferase
VRIGLICPYSLSVPGGVQGQVLGLARTYAARGHDVRVLGPCDAPPVEPWVVPVGSSVLNPSNGSVAPIAPDLGAQLRTLRALRDHDFDVVHLHEPLVPGPCATTTVMKPAPLVGTFHAAGDASDYQSYAWVARPLGHRLDALVAVSEEARAMAEPTLGGRWQILFNGVDLPRFAAAEPWPRSDGRRVLLFVGRHEERKGLAVLLEAVGRLSDDVVVWIAGDGPQTRELRARHRHDPRLEWLGRIPDDERDARMAAADVFCAPSIGGESFGVILLEAMAAGAPVVASAIRGYERVAGPLDGTAPAALLTPPGDPEQLADALSSVLDDPAVADELRTTGRARAAHFSLDRLADAYLDLYRRLSGSTPARRFPAFLGGGRGSLS